MEVPWGEVAGSHGRLFVTRRSGRETVNLDRLPLLTRPEGGEWVACDRSEELRRRDESRAAAKAAAARYECAVSRALALVARGVPLAYTAGQRGGFFTHPALQGAVVSAARIARECGLDLDDAVDGVVAGALRERPLPRRARRDEIAAALAAG